ncbi:rRNA maturation RNase YbeY [Sporosarcina pasteurii]|uniref:Endoribonuclease YbeY n=1 Tax=Sporosarcina pasteurii TaxID=1474 RepID=A0A380BQ86_SPOPA|nr:rRNA maturation RNase YbeY [Sporosarcina pasteurii]MDS9471031.1 rRNA maturation RNase YbeY [Sporosarcina pasteurii]QBQ05323.1 rRNA maturation RNase YbeY [Sporosarcina pasteurii]SUJ04050.1 Probable rRNA maturation factor [Sporosarcina pasteurii]
MLQLDINDETNKISDTIEELVTNLLNHAASAEGILEEAEVSVTFMTDEEIQEVNANYRGIDAPTDVISFALEEMTEGEVEIKVEADMPTVLGDILISTDTAERQAEEYGHSFKREIGFLALHGFLHLLGYDHMTEKDEKKMFGRQKEILDTFGLER